VLKRLLTACLACWVTNVMALPVVFTDSLYETSAVAIAGGSSDAQFAASPPNTLPVASDAAVIGNDLAIASGFAQSGLLITSADVSGTGAGSGIGTSRFQGTFTGGGVFGINFDFDTTDTADANAQAAGTLSLLLTGNGTTLLDEIFSVSGSFNLLRFIPVGDYTLDLLLSSEANTPLGGNAASLALVNFAGPTLVPEPATWLLLLLGVLLMSAWSQHGRHRQQPRPSAV